MRPDRDRGAEAGHARSTIAKFPWAASGRAITLARTEGLTKMIVDPRPSACWASASVGAGAGELIAEGVLAVEMGAIARDLR